MLPLRFIEKNPAFLCAMCSAHPETAWGAEKRPRPMPESIFAIPKG
jgi:hypothetical protein